MINTHINKVTLIGQFASGELKPRLDEHESLYTTFEVITELNKRTRNGQNLTRTVHHPVIAWGDLARLCYMSLYLGALIYLEGYLCPVGQYQNQEGNSDDWPQVQGYNYWVVAEQVRLLSPAHDNRRQPANTKYRFTQEETETEDKGNAQAGSFLFSDQPLIF